MKTLPRIAVGAAAVFFVAIAAVAQTHGEHEHHTETADTTSMHAMHDGGDDDMAVKTVTGEVIDITCFVRHDSKGPEHIKCANYCAGLGMPLGILEDETNKIFLILPAGHAAPKESVEGFIGERVTAKLMLFRSGGLTGAEVMEIAVAVPDKG